MPTEFSPEVAMGLYANIPAVEAMRAIEIAKGIAVAFGDGKSLASCIYAITGDARAAQNAEIQSQMRRNDGQRS
jgi:hypothetical protein